MSCVVSFVRYSYCRIELGLASSQVDTDPDDAARNMKPFHGLSECEGIGTRVINDNKRI